MEFKIENGVLISVQEGWRRTAVIPNTVTEIGPYAFRGCKHVKKVVVPDGVTKIARHAFDIDYSHTIEEINIPATVTEIGDKIIGTYYAPKTIRYPQGYYFACPIFHAPYNKHLSQHIADWPVPLDPEVYGTVLARCPGIKRIYMYCSEDTMTPLTVEEFLTVIEEACATGKLYLRETLPQDKERCEPIWPGNMVVQNGHYAGVRFQYTEISYREMASGDWGTYWNDSIRILRPEDGAVTNRYDTWDGHVQGTAQLLAAPQ